MSKIKLTPLAKRKLGAAKAALNASMRVLALQPRSKAPDIRFCTNGADSATDDPMVVKEWLREDPSINLGAVTKASPVLVVDVHGPEGEAALKHFGPLPETRETITRDGRHLYFRHDGRIKGSKIGLEPKLDIIASGYVVLPESSHPEGDRYRSDDIAAPIAKLPGRVVNAILARGKSPQRKKAQLGGAVLSQGSRDNRLTSLAGSFRRQGFDGEVIATALHAVNEKHCKPPLPDKDIERIAPSVCVMIRPAMSCSRPWPMSHRAMLIFWSNPISCAVRSICSKATPMSARPISCANWQRPYRAGEPYRGSRKQSRKTFYS